MLVLGLSRLATPLARRLTARERPPGVAGQVPWRAGRSMKPGLARCRRTVKALANAGVNSRRVAALSPRQGSITRMGKGWVLRPLCAGGRASGRGIGSGSGPAFPQLNRGVVGLAGLEPAASSLSGFCPGRVSPGSRLQPARTTYRWRPLETVTNRSAPMGCGPNVDQARRRAGGPVPSERGPLRRPGCWAARPRSSCIACPSPGWPPGRRPRQGRCASLRDDMRPPLTRLSSGRRGDTGRPGRART